jgi:hypothetical protein
MPPSPPQIDFNVAKDGANNIHDILEGIMHQWGVPDWFRPYVSGGIAGLVFVIAYVVLVIMQAAIAIGSWCGSLFLTMISTAKQENSGAMNDLLATTVNEMLGTSLSGSSLSSGSGGASSMSANQQIGDSLLGIFEQTFGIGGAVSPDQGAQNARKFAGFGVSFAISQGFLSILGEAASLGFLKEFHELPDGLMRALGIGRLQRLSMQPLIRNAIQQPYDLYMRQQFRPDRLAEAALIKAYHNGLVDEADCTTQLQQKGYPDDAISVLLTDTTPPLSVGDVLLLLNNGEITQQDAINSLTIDGLSETTANQMLRAAQLSAQAAEVSSYLSELETQYVGGYMDEGTWNSILKSLPLGDDQEQMYRNRVGLRVEGPRTAVSFADVKNAIVEGITDFSYLDTWMQFHGYSQQDQLILTYQVIEAMKTAADKETAKQYKAALLQKANKPVPPWLQG